MPHMRFSSILYIILSLWVGQLSCKAQVTERATAFTDKDCYVVGERMHVRVNLTDESGKQPSNISRVAYVEVADTASLQAQAMVLLEGGQGWADIALPTTMHSGYYMLSVYSRQMINQGADTFHRQLIGVVNPMHVTRRDAIKYHTPTEGEAQVRSYSPGQMISVGVPSVIQTLSVERDPLAIQGYDAPSARLTNKKNIPAIPEVEGHIVMASTSTNTEAQKVMLAGVGKGSFLVDGQACNDSLWCFYTHDMAGNLPIIAYASNDNGSVPVQLQSPYVTVLPKALPTLDVWCTEDALLRRAQGADEEATISHWAEADTIKYSLEFLEQQPDRFYNMDEYTNFSTIREAMVEFINGVTRRSVQGVVSLFTPDANTGIYSKFPALVLLDGMPVYDIDKIMKYDARLLNYIQIYNGVYTFGSTTVHGVISFISRRGLLSNFQIDEKAQLARYAFPQDHPQFVIANTPHTSTCIWQPKVNASRADFKAPSQPGRYLVTLQGIDNNGERFKSTQWIEVKE